MAKSDIPILTKTTETDITFGDVAHIKEYPPSLPLRLLSIQWLMGNTLEFCEIIWNLVSKQHNTRNVM